MKKILRNIILILMIVIMPVKVCAVSTSDALEVLDVNKESSLTLNYYYDDYKFNDVGVKIYYIASVDADFKYQLSSDYISYPIKINDIATEYEWNSLVQTLMSYIEADGIEETREEIITNNMVSFSGLKPGLYLVKTDKIDTEDYTLMFEECLLNIPMINEDGTWNYEVTVNPKAEEYIPKYEKITYTVVKEWIDDKSTRPKSIDIEIYKNGSLVERKILSSENNWTYQWITDDDGSSWTVVERNIPSNYYVTISNENRNFVIVNTNPDYKEENPKTLDDIKLYLYLLVGAIMGFVLLAISIIIQKKHVE